MSLYEQIEIWKRNRTLIELHVITPRNQKRRIYGRIYAFDPIGQTILFYNDDNKVLENLTLNEIENAFPSSLDVKEKASPADKEHGTIKGVPVSSLNRETLLNEIVERIRELPEEDLVALLPLVKRLHSRS